MTLSAVTNEFEPTPEEAFDIAVSKDLSEDEIKMAMIKAGCSFRAVGKLYNKLMIDRGHQVHKDDKRNTVELKCKGKALGNEKVFKSVAKQLMDTLPNCNERSAFSLIRAYARRNDILPWIAPPPERNGRQGFGRQYREYILEVVSKTSTAPTREQALDFIMGRNGAPETSESTKASKSVHLGLQRFAEDLLDAAQ